MKNLILVRHAKSEASEDGSIRDIDRPLNKRGYREAYKMCNEILPFLNGKILFVSSPSVRTYTTAVIFSDKAGYNRSNIVTDMSLYESEPEKYIDYISTIEKSIDTVLIFGHNPTFSQLVSGLSGEDCGDLPPCSIAVIEIDTDGWEAINRAKSNLKALFSPKN